MYGYRSLQQENILACAFKTRGMLAEDEGPIGHLAAWRGLNLL